MPFDSRYLSGNPPATVPNKKFINGNPPATVPNKKFINEDVWNAAHAGDLERLRYLLREGLHPTLRPDLVHEKEAARMLVRAARPCDGVTPIFAAAAGGFVTVVDYLLLMGADPAAPRHDGASPFYIACLLGHLPVATLLAGVRGPSILAEVTMDDWTPLLAAVSRGHVDVVVFLVNLSRRALNARDFERVLEKRTVTGHTAVQLAKRRGRTQIAAFLEWNLGVTGTEDSGNRGDYIRAAKGKRFSAFSENRAACGLQAFVENNGGNAAIM